MRDEDKTKEQLIRELVEKRQRIAELERSGVEREWIEEALRESEARYRALFDRTLYCVYVHDFEGRFLDVNPAPRVKTRGFLWYRYFDAPLHPRSEERGFMGCGVNDAALNLLGYERDEILSLHLSSLLDEDQLRRAFKVIEVIMRTGSQKGIAEFRLRKKDGEYVWVETEASLIYREGKPYAIQGIAREITRRKKMEEELRALSLVDELTGLYKRRGFLTLAQQQLKIASRLNRCS